MQHGFVLLEMKFGEGHSGLAQQDDDLCPFSRLHAAFDAHFLNLILGAADTCCVNKSECYSLNLDDEFHKVAGSTLHVAYDGAVVTDELVEQSRLANICFSDDGHRYSCLESLPPFKRFGELLDA